MQYRIPLHPPDISPEVQQALGAEIAAAGHSQQKAFSDFYAALRPHFPAREMLALNSCTAALHLGLRLLGVGEGDRVLCPTFTFAATVNAILYQQATPVFIDSEAGSWNMDPVLVEQALADQQRQGKKVAAIVVVHAYGTPARLDELKALASAFQLPLLEDAAAAFGAYYKGAMVGTLGDCGAYSFNYNKIITTAGGGLLVSKQPGLIEQADYLAGQARAEAPYYHHEQMGYNYRMNGLAAQLGALQLAHFRAKLMRKKQLFTTYRQLLEGVGGIAFQELSDDVESNYWLTSFLAPSEEAKEKVLRRLRGQGIECRMLWRPMHCQPAYSHFPFYSSGVAEELFQRGISLPSGVGLTESQQQAIVELVEQSLLAD